MPSPTTWIAVLSVKMSVSPAPGAAAAARVEQAAVARSLAAVAVVLARRRAPEPLVVGGEARHELAVAEQLDLHRVDADPVLLLDLALPGSPSESAYCVWASFHQVILEAWPPGRRPAPRPRPRVAVWPADRAMSA